MDTSVIIRFRNEARYLEDTLQAVCKQRFPGQFEIIAVDNRSEDDSAEIAATYADELLSIDTYRPGRALNQAINVAQGKFIAVLSAHTIPADENWLSRLRVHMDSPKLAGVYGGQLYNINAKFLDKRDLDIFSTLAGRIETQNSDFWNANSMFPRSIWELKHFNEKVYELEDHYWTKQLLPKGYQVHFEPRSLVYHYSHINRIDREYLPLSALSDREQIENAITSLEKPDANWPHIMAAGLTLSSLTKSPWIRHAVPAIGRHLVEHWDFDVRWRMAQALGKIPTSESVHFLVKALEDPSFYPRDEAAWSLARLGVIAAPVVEDTLKSLNATYRPFAALALGLSGLASAERMAIDILLSGLCSSNWKHRRDAAYFAGEIADIPGASRLTSSIAALLSENAEMCKVACWATGCFSNIPNAVIDWTQIYRMATSHPDLLVRYEAVVAIGKRARMTLDESAVDQLLAACDDDESRVRYGAIQSIRLMAEDGVTVPVPEQLKSDVDFGISYEVKLIKDQYVHPTSEVVGSVS